MGILCVALAIDQSQADGQSLAFEFPMTLLQCKSEPFVHFAE
jgi:hypothetical protein